MKNWNVRFLLVLCATPTLASASCGSSFCSLHTDWDVQEVATTPGWRVGARLEYIDQDQPRRGTDAVDVGAIRAHHDEVRTINRNMLLDASATLAPRWGVSVTVPIVDRTHTHIHNHHGEKLLERWRFTELGDVRVLGRHELFDGHVNAASGGVQFGVKLPTGRFDVRNEDGDEAERSLQPGSGTTDILLGGYYQQTSSLWRGNWFARVMTQTPLQARDGYKPGDQLLLDLGGRYQANQSLAMLFQLNALVKGRDEGRNAETHNSGSKMIALSPGVSYALSGNTQLFAFYQWPAYQHVNGVQLTADQYFSAGISTRF